MRRQGFTLIELLIVMVIIALLAALLLPALVRAVCAAKETATVNLISNMENACRVYERDQNKYPDTAPNFMSGTCVFALSKPGPKKLPYMSFKADEVADNAYPPTVNSHAKSKVNSLDYVRYRNNTTVPPPAGAKNKMSIDFWAQDCEFNPADASKQTYLTNWGSKLLN